MSTGTINSGRAAGKLESLIHVGEITQDQAEWMAQLEFGLDADEVDDAVERIRRFCQSERE